MKKEMEEIPDGLNPEFILSKIASCLTIKVAKSAGLRR